MSKNVTIRLNEDNINALKSQFGGIQAAITLIAEPFNRLRARTINELRGYFTEQEATALLDSQNGTLLTPDFVYNKAFFVAQLEDFETLESGISRHNADPKILIEKVRNLSHSQVYYLFLDIHIYWNETPASSNYFDRFKQD